MRRVLPEAVADESSGFALPAPVGGWNARDGLPSMSPKDAIYLDNWFPSTTDVVVRPGRALKATIPAGRTIETLLNCALSDGTSKRFAAAEDGFYNVTAGGVIAAPDEVMSSGRWEYVNINIGGIPYLWCACGDGVNKARLYRGSDDTWITLDGASVPVLTGPVSVNVTNVSLWKYRTILCVKNSLSFWHGPLNSVGGTFAEFPLGAVFKKGGYLVATANWTLDAGDGPDDRFVAITSEGEVAVYAGTDPSDATAFSLVGVYDIGQPLGKRCVVSIAGDLAVLTEQGLWPLSRALQSATIDRKPLLTDKIQQAFNSFQQMYGTEFGWQPLLFPKAPAMVVNVPIGLGRSYQFVMNTITGAWCRFLSWNSTCMMISDKGLYTAASNRVHEAWVGRADDAAAITASAKTAFTYAGSRSSTKHVKLVKPVMTASASISIGLTLDTDFSVSRSVSSTSSLLSNIALWDTAIWDQALWAGSATTINKWRTVTHRPGKAFSLQLRVQVKNIAVSWNSTDFIAEKGGLFG